MSFAFDESVIIPSLAVITILVGIATIFAKTMARNQRLSDERQQRHKQEFERQHVAGLNDLLNRVATGMDTQADELIVALNGQHIATITEDGVDHSNMLFWAQVPNLDGAAPLRQRYQELRKQAQKRVEERAIHQSVEGRREEGAALHKEVVGTEGYSDRIDALRKILCFLDKPRYAYGPLLYNGEYLEVAIPQGRVAEQLGISWEDLLGELNTAIQEHANELGGRLRPSVIDHDALEAFWLLCMRTSPIEWERRVRDNLTYTNDLGRVGATPVEPPRNWSELVATYAEDPYRIELYLGESLSSTLTPEMLTLRGSTAVAHDDPVTAAIVLAHWFHKSLKHSEVPDGLRTQLSEMVARRREMIAEARGLANLD